MNLHNFKESFYELIEHASIYYNVDEAYIEKDYYVSLLLKEINSRFPYIVFKGGTSLSKCYKIIDRFSEDIDLTLDVNNQTQSSKKNLKHKIIEVCNELEFELLNESQIRSRRDYNCYEIKYPIQFDGIGIKQFLLVETVFMVKSFPDEIKPVTCMVYDFWKQINDEDAISEFKMEPFEIRVQTLERTFVDKVFAICDYAVSNNTTGFSRHIYDLYKLSKYVVLDYAFKNLVNIVREERKKHNRCYTAQDKYDIPYILKQIIEKNTYYDDYNEVTRKILFDETSYETAITIINKIIESGVFEK